MKKIIIPVFFCILIVFSCGTEKTDNDITDIAKKIIPRIEGEIFHTEQRNSSNTVLYSSRPEIPLSPSDTPILTIYNNLDIDTPDEQIIAVKQRDKKDSYVRIIIADLQKVYGNYQHAWEGTTKAVNIRTFRIDLKDVTGDHELEIICSGMDADGNLTLDIFRKIYTSGFTLEYYPICQLKSNGTIEIIEFLRDPGYLAGQKLGESFDIISYSSDHKSENTLDIIKETYYFYSPTGKYELKQAERISKEKVAESQLSSIYNSTSPDIFKNHLKGLWYKTDQNEKEDAVILSFDPDNEEIIFYSSYVQEVYTWKYSKRSGLYNILIIFAENELLHSIQPNFTITLTSLDQIELFTNDLSGNEQWGGKYKKINDKETLNIFNNQNQPADTTIIELEGTFKSAENDLQRDIEITFQKNHFTWTTPEDTFSGGYVIYPFPQGNIEITTLLLKIVKDGGLNIEDRVFILDYTEETTEENLIKKLTLTPAKISVHGITAESDQALLFIQKQSLSDIE